MEVNGLPSSVHDKILYLLVCSVFGDIEEVCNSNDIEDCHWIKEKTTIIKFSSQKKSSEALNKKKKLKNIGMGKYGLNYGSRIHIKECLCHYYWGLQGKCKGLWQDNFIDSFCTISDILWVKKSEHDKPIILTHDKDLLQCRYHD